MLTVLGVLLGLVTGVAGAVLVARVRARVGWHRGLPAALLMAAVVVAFMLVDGRGDDFPWATTALLVGYVVTHLVQLRRAGAAGHSQSHPAGSAKG